MEQEKGLSFRLAICIPVPLILLFAPSWDWILVANVMLGVNQGLAWSMTVNMKIDLVGKEKRGLALGLNEFAGYISVAIVGFLTGYIAAAYGLKPYPFCLGIAFSLLGFIISVTLVKDTSRFTELELQQDREEQLKKEQEKSQEQDDDSSKIREKLTTEKSEALVVQVEMDFRLLDMDSQKLFEWLLMAARINLLDFNIFSFTFCSRWWNALIYLARYKCPRRIAAPVIHCQMQRQTKQMYLKQHRYSKNPLAGSATTKCALPPTSV